MGILDCIFCKIIRKEIPSIIIKENEHLMVIKDLHPKAPVHNLIIPKKHINDMSDITEDDKEILWEMNKMVKTLAAELDDPKAFNIMSNNGSAAGQTIFHMHWHFLSGENIFIGKFE
jgi:histidine triad (HIT) family protein